MATSSPTLRPLRVLISAGEASGELYGAQLIRALAELHGPVEAFGLGGERMKDVGCRLVVEARDVAVVGLFEVLSHLPSIYGHFHRLLDEMDRRRPDVAVLIDFPDWNFRLARELHRRGIPVVYYVSPQLWAWRKGRLKLVQRYVREMLVIFPFEREFYARHGVEAEFVGHPLAEIPLPTIARAEFAARWQLDPQKLSIALLPGSRRKELRMNLAAILGAAERLGKEFEYVMPVASTLSEDWVRGEIADCADLWDKRGKPRNSNLHIVLTDDARASLLHSRVGIVASGTATMEAALIGTPFVMVYRVAGLTYTFGRHLVKLAHYGMVNLVAGRRVVPELIQHGFTAETVEHEVRRLLPDGAPRQAMLEALAEVRGKLRGGLAESSAQDTAHRAARAVLRVAEMGRTARE
ncbi:MAG: lipid-A-disaccharide synthase [Acidobacteriota bacterium]|nr:lipid-A-disaccharide synthase [Acidobacteriota bacterium]